MKDQLVKVFKEKFGSEGDIRSYFAPGRVNLIGEHTDYNGGHVFPCALTIGTYAIVRKREDRNFRFYSTNFESLGVIEPCISHLCLYLRDLSQNLLFSVGCLLLSLGQLYFRIG